MTVERRSRRFSTAVLERVARRLMNASPLCSLATVTPGGRAHINHMYFAWTDRFEVVWISDPDSLHSRNLTGNRSAAVTIYASNQVWGKPDRGIQLFGTAAVTASPEAPRAYGKRFRDFDAGSNDLPYYRFRPRTVKLFDERSLAGGTLVTARVTRDGLAWLKTEVWA
ncbi:MAG: pyridoxamine 5'-phosphate oxidase family protein [Chloroflexi bacterium]|nr:MAG: pyridoxamine 5'-phosphate oxidase family protein [Chloroflexota bacterium]